MIDKTSKAQKIAGMLKRTAQKLVGNPRTISKELKKLALTLPLMALLVEEVRAAQEKVKIDPSLIVGNEVFPDEQALAEFIEEQNLDQVVAQDIEQELEDVLLAQATPEEETERKALLLEGSEGAGAAAGSQSSAVSSADGAIAAAASDGAAFELAGLPLLGAAAGPLGLFAFAAAGVAVANTDDGNAAVTTQADGTVVGNSLKELQALGVNFVDAAAGQDTINVNLGSGSFTAASLPGFGDANRDGSISTAEDEALQVNLVASNSSQLNEIANSASSLSLADNGIDNVHFTLADQSALNALLASSTLSADLASLAASGLAVDIDMGTASSIQITQAQAQTLIDNGVQFAANDNIQIDAAGTQVQGSLKDLQKLGVDNVIVSTDQSIDLGTGGPLLGSLPTFTGNADITLNVADAAGLSDVSNVALGLHNSGIDHIDLASNAAVLTQSQALNLSGSGLTFAANDDITLGVSAAELSNSLLPQATSLDNLGVDHIDLLDNAITLSGTQAQSLINAGLDFAAADNVTVAVDGTHLSTSLASMQTLGVDNVVLNIATTPDLNFALNHSQALADGGVGMINITTDVAQVNYTGADNLNDADITFATEDDISLTITADAAGNVDFVSAMNNASALQTLGVDHIDFASNAGFLNTAGAMSLIDAGIDFAANDQMLLVSNATYVSGHVSELKALGIDHLQLLDAPNFGALNAAASALVEAGLGNIDLYADDFADLTSLVTLQSLQNQGVDFNVHYSDTADLDGFNNLIRLYNATDRTSDLATVLQDAGISNIIVDEGNTQPFWADSLAADLHAAGILTAAESATVVVDVLNSPVLKTTAKAMAELGVDGINAEADGVNTTTTLSKVFVGLGTTVVDEIQTILDSFANADIFSLGTDGALVIQQSVSDELATLSDADASALLSQLSELGFNEVDVINDTGDAVEAFKIVAQTVGTTPMVQLIGITSSDADVHSAALDEDILAKLGTRA